MKIDNKTKMKDFIYFATDERMLEIRKQLGTDCDFDFWDLTIGEFSAIFDNKIPEPIQKRIEDDNITVFEVAKLQNGFIEFLDKFKEIEKTLEIQKDGDEVRALSSCVELTPVENMLIFCQKYFGHKDFGQSEKITLLEYIIARKAQYNEIMFQKTYQAIQRKKINLKK